MFFEDAKTASPILNVALTRRNGVDGVSPRMVTILLTRPEFRAGFAHGETLEIRVGGRGLSMMARGDGGKAIFIAKEDHLFAFTG